MLGISGTDVVTVCGGLTGLFSQILLQGFFLTFHFLLFGLCLPRPLICLCFLYHFHLQIPCSCPVGEGQKALGA